MALAHPLRQDPGTSSAGTSRRPRPWQRAPWTCEPHPSPRRTPGASYHTEDGRGHADHDGRGHEDRGRTAGRPADEEHHEPHVDEPEGEGADD
ncbi:hypothetical protein QJS66_18690 [Kocuria rhizophila]|nr:hypothetical protein QJS66_18690 [Kocuria rhizophila]